MAESTYVLRFDRNDLVFMPGQYITVGASGRRDMREYSIYSGVDQPFLEILVKEVEGGLVSRELRMQTPGDGLAVEGPFGFFTMTEKQRVGGRFLFIATGTGISPHHCFALSYAHLDYKVLHGVRSAAERYDHQVFDPERYVSCVTRESTGSFQGNSVISVATAI